MKLIMKVSMIMIMIWDADALIGRVYVPHPTIFNYLSMDLVWWLPCKAHLKASIPESRRVVEGISRDFRDHRSFGQSVDGRSDGECWTEPQFLQFFDIKLLFWRFFLSCHVMSTESWWKGRDLNKNQSGFLLQRATYRGKRWKSPGQYFFVQLRHVM